MSKSDKQPIENAAEIIEKFGGIRPMSSKINVAVTTIQGWKKRGVIPAARTNAIIEAAKEHNIDISKYVDGATPVQNSSDDSHAEASDANNAGQEAQDETGASSEGTDDAIEGQVVEVQQSKELVKTERVDEFSAKRKQRMDAANKDYTELAVEIQKNAIKRSAIVASVIILVVVAATIGIMKPKFKEMNDREAQIKELETKISEMKAEQSSFKGLVPEDWKEELQNLKNQAAQTGQSVSQTVAVLSDDLSSEEGRSKRVEQLQTYVSEITGESGIYALTDRFSQMREDFVGRKVLDNSVSALLPILENSEGQDETQLNAMIDSAREKNASLQKSLDSVPQNELKAAAMLLAMTQVRSALNRGDEDFEGDLTLLKNMIGDEQTPLYNSIDKLAPHARSGILTPGGLRLEFQTVAGDAVAASLRGEEVSVSEKLSAKMNDILQVEKDGELITGTETQATLNEAENMISGDRWQEALDLLRTKLRAKELEPLRPWIKEVEKLINSRKLDQMLAEAIELNFGEGLLGGAKSLKSQEKLLKSNVQ